MPELNVVSDHIFTKTKSNALTSEAFAAFLQEHGISECYLAGADAAACIKSTSFNMRKNGYTVHVLSDCITSYDKRKLPELLSYYESKGCSVLALSCGHTCRISPEIATEGRRKSLVRQVKKHMDFRITADGNERDIREIHEMLKK